MRRPIIVAILFSLLGTSSVKAAAQDTISSPPALLPCASPNGEAAVLKAAHVAGESEYSPNYVECKLVQGEYAFNVVLGASSPTAFPVPADGIVRFPVVDGIEGVVTLRFTSPAPADAILTVQASLAVAKLPKPPGNNARVLAVLLLATNEEVAIASSPEWRIVMPSSLDTNSTYNVDTYDIKADGEVSWLSGEHMEDPNCRTLTTVASTCPIPAANGIGCASRTLLPGHTYAFEFVENELQPPRPWTPAAPSAQ